MKVALCPTPVEVKPAIGTRLRAEATIVPVLFTRYALSPVADVVVTNHWVLFTAVDPAIMFPTGAAKLALKVRILAEFKEPKFMTPVLVWEFSPPLKPNCK